jgi:branched-chain amino acid transport system ATP-binding protein
LGSKLVVRDIQAGYGAVRVLHGVSLEVNDGETVVLLGTNGNGKSTLIKCLMGIVRPDGGDIYLERDGQRVALVGKSPEEIVHLGITLVPEGRRLFPKLSVEENLLLGAFRRQARHDIAQNLAFCFEAFPILHARRKQLAGSMSGGEQQMLAIARALMLHPRLMLLDEPSLGLAPKLTRELFKILERIAREDGVTMLLVEQNANLVLQFADDAHVLEAGRIVLSGTAKEMQADEGIRRSYLGV